VPFLLCFTKRARQAGSTEVSKLLLKAGIDKATQELDEAEIKKQVKVMQYEAMITLDMREFKSGQVFQQFTEQNVEGVPKYNLIVRDAINEAQFAQKTMCCFVVPLGCEREMDIHNSEK